MTKSAIMQNQNVYTRTNTHAHGQTCAINGSSQNPTLDHFLSMLIWVLAKRPHLHRHFHIFSKNLFRGAQHTWGVRGSSLLN